MWSRADSQAHIHLHGGRVALLTGAQTPPALGMRLVSGGLLSLTNLGSALATQDKHPNMRLGDVLVRMGLVDRADVEAVAWEQMCDDMADILTWPEPTVTFTDAESGVVPPPGPSVEELLAAAAQRASQWQHVVREIGGPDTVPALSDDVMLAKDVALRPTDWAVLCRVDGRRSLRTIAKESGFTLLEAASILRGLLAAGLTSVPVKRVAPASSRVHRIGPRPRRHQPFCRSHASHRPARPATHSRHRLTHPGPWRSSTTRRTCCGSCRNSAAATDLRGGAAHADAVAIACWLCRTGDRPTPRTPRTSPCSTTSPGGSAMTRTLRPRTVRSMSCSATAAPDRPARHVVITGPLDDAVDAWDTDVAPQTLAGVLWSPEPTAEGGLDAILGWLALRTQTPATPLSDLVDANQRALRWSIAAARRVPLTEEVQVDVDDGEIRGWLDEQPNVRELGLAVDRIGGDTADATLTSTERFRQALHGLDALADLPGPDFTDLDGALAEHLRQVQRSGLGRWRSGRARALSQQRLSVVAREPGRGSPARADRGAQTAGAHLASIRTDRAPCGNDDARRRRVCGRSAAAGHRGLHQGPSLLARGTGVTAPIRAAPHQTSQPRSRSGRRHGPRLRARSRGLRLVCDRPVRVQPARSALRSRPARSSDVVEP